MLITDQHKQNYFDAMMQFLPDLERLILPLRKPKGDVRNYRRVLHVCAYFHQRANQLASKGKNWRCGAGCHLCRVRLRFAPPRALKASA